MNEKTERNGGENREEREEYTEESSEDAIVSK